jgi:DNA-directed RNA polymerase subunit H (RpoH/RPB5)
MNIIENYNKIKENIISMIKDRNIKIINKEENNDEQLYTKINNDLLILYYFENRVNIDSIKNIINEFDDINHYILIVNEKITTAAKKEILKYQNKEFEIFHLKEFRINIMKHYLQPKWKLLNKDKVNNIIKKNNKKLPYIKIDDRISRHFNAKNGDIFEITRYNQIYYRMVVS